MCLLILPEWSIKKKKKQLKSSFGITLVSNMILFRVERPGSSSAFTGFLWPLCPVLSCIRFFSITKSFLGCVLFHTSQDLGVSGTSSLHKRPEVPWEKNPVSCEWRVWVGKLQDPVHLHGHLIAVPSVLSQESSLFLPIFSLPHSPTHAIWEKRSLWRMMLFLLKKEVFLQRCCRTIGSSWGFSRLVSIAIISPKSGSSSQLDYIPQFPLHFDVATWLSFC